MLSRSQRARQRSRAESLGHADRMVGLGRIRELYDRPEHYADPDSFFGPPGAIAPRLTRVRALPDGQVLDAAWSSEFTPFVADLRDRYLATVPNRTAVARLHLHDGPARPAAILVHGYRTGQFALEERVMPLAWLYERGLDVALAVLPFHAVRAERGRALFPSSDPRFTNEGFRQAMLDLRALAGLLRERGAPAVGVMGMSLGGYTTSLLATVAADLAFAVPIIPLASIADFARDGDRYVGTPEERRLQHVALEAAHRVVSPLARPARLPPDRIVVIGGESDRITPIQHAQRLAEHFGAPLETFVGGHLLQFGRADAFRTVGRMLGRLGLLSARRADARARA
jgi:pimeloyl-ACP methyl ester carboxylesterase